MLEFMARKENSFDSISRRKFLALSGMVPAVVAARSMTNTAFAAAGEAVAADPAAKDKKYPIGLELYSVRNQLMHDLSETLRTVAKIGYTVVEFYAPYFDWKIPYCKYVRNLMEDLGLRCYSTHNHFESFTPGDTMSHAVELNQVLGSRLMVLASAPASAHDVEGWRKLCGQLTAAVDQLAPHGLSAGFHNHQTEWAPLDGALRTMDFIAANTPGEFVLQLDVGTCVQAGADPVAWIKANPGRIKVVHLKDWAPGGNADEKGYRVLFGEGVSPWKEILAAVESVGGVEYYLMEQEGSRFPEFETVQRCLEAWKKMRGEA
jgi:sugar phosphate isomerase/epimerase